MSQLAALLRSLHTPPAKAANSANPRPPQGAEVQKISGISTISRGVDTDTHFDVPEQTADATPEAGLPPLPARLEADPSIERAFVSRWDCGAMVITLAVRGVGTCELLIPPERFNADSLDDYNRLAGCILNPETPT